MSKMELVRAEMVKAMKSGEKERKDALSMLLAALKAKYIDKRADLTEDEENAVVQKEIKQTKETLETAPGRSRRHCRGLPVPPQSAGGIRAPHDGRGGDPRGAPVRAGFPRPCRPDGQGQRAHYEKPDAPRQGEG